MVYTRCISKLKDYNGAIIKYILEDEKGNRKEFTSSEIKQGINNRKLYVSNLKISRNNKLLDRLEDKPKIISAVEEYNNNLLKRTGRYTLKQGGSI